ncbi:MAG: hypothetical protein IT379_14730 [Deltaproteobacteria bacterium]|nr:hypothetical protein [Deltaproteobacteria bacterium]
MGTVLLGIALFALLGAALAWMFGLERAARRLGTGAIIVVLAPVLFELLVRCLGQGNLQSCSGAPWAAGIALLLTLAGLVRFAIWWWGHTREERSRRAQARSRAEHAARRRLPPPHEPMGEP